MPVSLSSFARGLSAETAFDVLAVAQRLKAQGKDVIELQIGDSPFPSTAHAARRRHPGHRRTARRTTARRWVCRLSARRSPRNYQQRIRRRRSRPENVVVGAGRQGLRAVLLRGVSRSGRRRAGLHARTFRPTAPTSNAAAPASVCSAAAAGKPVSARSQRRRSASSRRRRAPRRSSSIRRTIRPAAWPRRRTCAASPTWCAAATSPSSATSRTATWSGRAGTSRCWPSRACSSRRWRRYTFSKSYSMSGWRLGYAVSSPRIAEAIGKMINTSLSCVPPIVQLAGQAALEHDAAERDEVMQRFQQEGGAAGRRSCGKWTASRC